MSGKTIWLVKSDDPKFRYFFESYENVSVFLKAICLEKDNIQLTCKELKLRDNDSIEDLINEIKQK